MLHIVLNIWKYDDEVKSFALLLICNEDVSFASTVRLNMEDAWELATKLEHYLNKKIEVVRKEELHFCNYRIDNLFPFKEP